MAGFALSASLRANPGSHSLVLGVPSNCGWRHGGAWSSSPYLKSRGGMGNIQNPPYGVLRQ
jgi:hypothetical protein